MPHQNHERHETHEMSSENLQNPFENYENHENYKIPIENLKIIKIMWMLELDAEWRKLWKSYISMWQ